MVKFFWRESLRNVQPLFIEKEMFVDTRDVRSFQLFFLESRLCEI